MRIVAIALLTLVVAAASPAHAERLHALDECSDTVFLPGQAGSSCLRVDLPEPAATTAPEKLGGRVFVWMGESDVKWSTNAATGSAAILGAMYADSNGYPGLQRTPGVYGQQQRAADQVLLI